MSFHSERTVFLYNIRILKRSDAILTSFRRVSKQRQRDEFVKIWSNCCGFSSFSTRTSTVIDVELTSIRPTVTGTLALLFRHRRRWVCPQVRIKNGDSHVYKYLSVEDEKILTRNRSQDVLSPDEMRTFTITITRDGNITLTGRGHGIILSAKDSGPKPLRFFTFWSLASTTWKFNCTSKWTHSSSYDETILLKIGLNRIQAKC